MLLATSAMQEPTEAKFYLYFATFAASGKSKLPIGTNPRERSLDLSTAVTPPSHQTLLEEKNSVSKCKLCGEVEWAWRTTLMMQEIRHPPLNLTWTSFAIPRLPEDGAGRSVPDHFPAVEKSPVLPFQMPLMRKTSMKKQGSWDWSISREAPPTTLIDHHDRGVHLAAQRTRQAYRSCCRAELYSYR